jgi:CRISPR-associated endonuclease Csn1
MSTKILGLDLGTNSIGWAIRDTDELLENQIIDYGVIVFRKGVGDGKSGEFSLAAERRKNRSKRRLYNAKRYRKWELLKVLIEEGMCPLTKEELKLWSAGDWQSIDGEKKNLGRVYPMGNAEFQKWLALDPSYFGDKGKTKKGKTIRKSPYDLRCELIERYEDDEQTRKNKIGRALYHFAQRRGFKTSRKSGKSSYGESELLRKFYEKYPDKAEWKLAQVLRFLQSDECNDKELRLTRIRKEPGVFQRIFYIDEVKAICKVQKVKDELITKFTQDDKRGTLYYVRGPRGQKGLVGRCTLERGKPRIPISHPAFEEFRALQFINNLQWKEKESKKPFESIPMSLKKKILEELFFRKIERGQNKGKVSTDAYIKFDEIIERYSEKGKYEFNYKNKPNLSVCPVIAGLMNVFEEEWKDKFINDEHRFGINWSGLTLEYTVQYGKKKGQKRRLGYEEIWHLLFDFLQTRNNEDELKDFCRENLGWSDDRAKEFAEIDIQQGYGSLSRSGIIKILPYLQEGHIYSEAVSFANLSKVFGKEKFLAQKDEIKQSIRATIKAIDKEKEKLNIVNSLIQKYFGELETIKAERLWEKIKTEAESTVIGKLESYFGTENWNSKFEEEQREYFNFVFDKYVVFLDGKQKPEEKAAWFQGKNPERDYYKLPRLDEAIKQVLKEKFSATDVGLKHLYHPSDIEIYPKAKTKQIVDKETGETREVPQLGDPQPPSKGFKNPMAMRTLYELKHLINYLLEVGKINKETKIVIEIARELNDTNKRWAVQMYQQRREEENKEFAKAILGVAKPKYPDLNENDADNIDKVRLWWEQLPNGEELYKQVKELKDDVEKYRLWKEQECQCIYTGKVIKLTDLFDGTKTQFAHTFQRSESFDSSLANLTVSDAYYNMNIQQNRIPTQLENYKKDWKNPQNGVVYTAIEPRLKKWIEKRDSLRVRIEKNKKDTMKAKARGDSESRNKLIGFRRLLELDLDYWDKKVRTFTDKEIPKWWKNSQIVDTQIVTKYARAYMKSLFTMVGVQKARQNANDSQDGMVNIFKKIYEIKGDEQKDRSRHTHHAMDAAVLTLIPGSARREEILKQYYFAQENNKHAQGKNRKFHTIPYPTFDITHVSSIDNEVLINHVGRDRTMIPTYKKVRKRGEVQFVKNGDGTEVPMVMQGDSVRGQLHQETFFGAIKVPERNEKGYAVKKDGKYLLRKSKKNGEDEIWIVSRKPIKDVDLKSDKIVDEVLKNRIEQQLKRGVIKSLTEATDFQGKRIRHLRCAFKAGRGYLTPEKAIELKKHSHLSKHEHKQFVLVKNSIEGNYLYLFYENEDGDKPKRKAKIISLFDFRNEYGLSNVDEIWKDKVLTQTEDGVPLKYILRVGQRAIFYSETKEELKALSDKELNDRVFVIYKFNESGTPDLYLKNHIEARPNPEIDKLCKNDFDPDDYQPGLSLKAIKLNCIFEGKDFEIRPDGEIVFLNNA